MIEVLVLLFIMVVAAIGGRMNEINEELDGFEHIWDLSEGDIR